MKYRKIGQRYERKCKKEGHRGKEERAIQGKENNTETKEKMEGRKIEREDIQKWRRKREGKKGRREKQRKKEEREKR